MIALVYVATLCDLRLFLPVSRRFVLGHPNHPPPSPPSDGAGIPAS
jgi:hypothetical protein